LTVRYGDADGPVAVDLALPSAMDVGQLLPTIVDFLDRESGTVLTGCGWQLARLGGYLLDESKSLAEQNIHDGEVLLLTGVQPPAPLWAPADACHTVAQLAGNGDAPARRLMRITGCLVAGVTATGILLVLPGPATARLATGAGLALAATTGALATRRDEALSTALTAAAVMFATAAGHLAVPAGPIAAHAVLSSAVAFSTAILLMRLIRSAAVFLVAVATITLPTAAVAAATLTWRLPGSTAGALLAALALITLSVAPRFAIAIAGIGPPVPDVEGDAEPTTVTECDAARAHQMLTGLVAGSSVAAALSTALVACADPWPGGVAFAALVGVLLLLRGRTHVDTTRHVALVVCGWVGIAAGFVVAARAAPGWAHMIGLLAAASGGGMLVTAGPLVRRAIEVTEYIALAAFVPVACWVGGLFQLVRGTGLW
jgi:type VII secretion integral membrane protein EccD